MVLFQVQNKGKTSRPSNNVYDGLLSCCGSGNAGSLFLGKAGITKPNAGMNNETTDWLRQLAGQSGFHPETIQLLWEGLRRTGGGQVQFDIPELGGPGQWQRGMLMISDWNNHALKTRLSTVLDELSSRAAVPEAAADEKNDDPSEGWRGRQNETGYVFYPGRHLLIVNEKKAYDTRSYQVYGFGQSQQNGRQELTLLTNKGEISLSSLPETTWP